MRRYAALLLAVLTLGAGLVVVAGLGSVASSSPSVDRALSARQCALAGRVYHPGLGCSRRQCVRGAFMTKEGFDAELCERSGRKGWAYGQPINSQRCRQLGRVWTGPINICESNPDRRHKVIRHAPQCLDPRATYVSQREVEGWYDECLSPRRLRQLSRVAKSSGISLPRAAKDRSAHNCDYRGGWVFVDGVCERRVGPPPAGALGGTFMTGDSVSWRGWDDLRRRTHGWTLDLRPGRRLDELAGRLDWYRADHGDPDRVIIELGTNRRVGYTEGQFRATMATIPADTPVLMFLPFREPTRDNASLVASTKRYAGWIKRLAADRPRTCVADWPSYASQHLSNLVDGEHPDRQHEDWYARYVVRAWDNCSDQLHL